jgi:hypothetical protein
VSCALIGSIQAHKATLDAKIPQTRNVLIAGTRKKRLERIAFCCGAESSVLLDNPASSVKEKCHIHSHQHLDRPPPQQINPHDSGERKNRSVVEMANYIFLLHLAVIY